jgi:DMSO/TMAO reductase YedYZ molybdopterin-dependent catalytic subunit
MNTRKLKKKRKNTGDRRHFLQVFGVGAAAVALGACDSKSPNGDRDADLPGPDGGAPIPDGGSGGAPDLEPILDNSDFYVTSSQGTPSVDPNTWRLEINGAVDNPVSLTLDDLKGLGTLEKEHTLLCIGSSPGSTAVGNAIWGGRPLNDVLAAFNVGPQPSAIELQFEGADTYTTSVPVTDLDDRELWLVWEMNGEPLPTSHGFPVRVLTPDRYGIKNPKWLTHLTLGTEPLLGYWESRGWNNDGSYRPVVYFLSPPRNSEHDPTVVALQGSAFCGSTAITKVEVSTDNGDTWHEADITYQGPQDVWTLWRYDWQPDAPGDYDLLARIECADGRATDPDYEQDLGGYTGYGLLSLTIG